MKIGDLRLRGGASRGNRYGKKRGGYRERAQQGERPREAAAGV
jgi:hypothetical protein